jgi:hypothetical protein
MLWMSRAFGQFPSLQLLAVDGEQKPELAVIGPALYIFRIMRSGLTSPDFPTRLVIWVRMPM